MPSYTLAEIASLATKRQGRRNDISLSDMSQMVNMAYQDVWNDAPSQMLEKLASANITVSSSTLTVPADLWELLNLRLTVYSSQTTPGATRSYKTLTRLSPEHIDANYSDSSGEPYGYVLYSTWLELYPPSPMSNYSLQFRYRAFATDMTATTAVPSLTTPWRHAVLLKTEVYLNEHIGNFPGASYCQDQYLSYVMKLKTDEARRQSNGRMYVAPVYTGVKRDRWVRSSLFTQ
jgi:hypothetical protein